MRMGMSLAQEAYGVSPTKEGHSQWASRKVSVSPVATEAPSSRAVIRPFLSRWRTTRTMCSLFRYSSSSSLSLSAETAAAADTKAHCETGPLKAWSPWYAPFRVNHFCETLPLHTARYCSGMSVYSCPS